jgi:methylglyoxal synthase
MDKQPTIALVAHDNKKDDLVKWCRKHLEILKKYRLVATGTTGKQINKHTGLTVNYLASGPLGGDLQIGAMIAESKVNYLVFFWDPLEAQPHDPDIKALLRISAVWNIPVACNEASADYIFSSSLLNNQDYQPTKPNYKPHLNRELPS